MFTDMVGFTALMQSDELLARERRDQYMRAVERNHDDFAGVIVQRLGDGTMSRFASSLNAVLAGVEIQRELVSQGVLVRIGVHVGEVVVDENDLIGDAVNIASRIESFAVAGGVMISDTAYDNMRNRTDIDVVSIFSPSALANLQAEFGHGTLRRVAARAALAAVGPATAVAIRDAGLPLAIVAKEATAASVVRAVSDYFAAGSAAGVRTA